MSKQAIRLHRSEFFELLKKTKRNSKKVYYEICMTGWIPVEAEQAHANWPNRVRDIVDPLRVKSGEYGRQWRFRNLKDAEQLYTMLTLKWTR